MRNNICGRALVPHASKLNGWGREGGLAILKKRIEENKGRRQIT
jgi:hypothetical protein